MSRPYGKKREICTHVFFFTFILFFFCQFFCDDLTIQFCRVAKLGFRNPGTATRRLTFFSCDVLHSLKLQHPGWQEAFPKGKSFSTHQFSGATVDGKTSCTSLDVCNPNKNGEFSISTSDRQIISEPSIVRYVCCFREGVFLCDVLGVLRGQFFQIRVEDLAQSIGN